MIVRELITKLGFQADYQALQRWNKGVDKAERERVRATAKAERERTKAQRQGAIAAERSEQGRTRKHIENAKAIERAEKQLAATTTKAARESANEAIKASVKRNAAAKASLANQERALKESQARYKALGLGARDDAMGAMSHGGILDRVAARHISGNRGARRWTRANRSAEARAAREQLAETLSQSPRLLDRFSAGILRSDRYVQSFARSLSSAALSGAKLLAIGGAAALGGLGYMATQKAATFETLRAGLVTANEGDTGAADADFTRVQEFARETPFTVEQITDAVLRLKNLGLDAGNEALQAYGNVAASFPGKTIIDFIEAIADATTFEFERLKEFGIKTRQEGDKVFFTFRGVTTEVEKTADSVAGYLQNIGQTAFGGAMANQMNTFRGVMSNLQDSWDQFLVSVADQGLLDAMKDIGKEFSAMLGGSDDLSVSLGQLLASSVRGLWDLFKEIQPELRETILKLIDLTQNSSGLSDVIGGIFSVMGTTIEAFKSFSDAMGGTTNAVYALLPAVVALSVAMLGLVGLPGVIAASLIAALPALMKFGDWIGDTLGDIERLGVNAALRAQGMDVGTDTSIRSASSADHVNLTVKGRDAARRTLKTLSTNELSEIAGSGTFRGAGGLSTAAREEAQGQLVLRQVAGAEDQRVIDAMSAPMRTNEELLAKKEKEARDRSNRRKPGGKKKKKKKELSLEEMLERDFGGGMGGVMKAADGSEFRPTLGTTINKVTLDNHPTVNMTFDMPPLLPGDTAQNYSERFIRHVAEKHFNEQMRIATEFFKGAGK